MSASDAGDDELGTLRARAAALISELAAGGRSDDARDALLVDLARAQAHRVVPYGRLVRSRGVDLDDADHPDEVPALPTDVYRYARIASFPEAQTVRAFQTSGTTHGARGVHAFRDLGLYDQAARASAAYALFTGLESRERTDGPHLLILAPHPDEASDSSLSYMLGRFEQWFGAGRTTWLVSGGAIDLPAFAEALRARERDGGKVVLLGTSFAFVHADDGFTTDLGDARFELPEGSRIMQTGGFKGRSREVPPPAMRSLLSARYGVPATRVVAEYGMTELSSQMYETTLLAPEEPRRLWVPGWVRATPVDPETLAPIDGDGVGILRIDDVANVDSVASIQTADLARRVGDGIEVLGRTDGAVPRGCSLAMDAALSGAVEDGRA